LALTKLTKIATREFGLDLMRPNFMCTRRRLAQSLSREGETMFHDGLW
jgi:hypothetical protein